MRRWPTMATLHARSPLPSLAAIYGRIVWLGWGPGPMRLPLSVISARDGPCMRQLCSRKPQNPTATRPLASIGNRGSEPCYDVPSGLTPCSRPSPLLRTPSHPAARASTPSWLVNMASTTSTTRRSCRDTTSATLGLRSTRDRITSAMMTTTNVSRRRV